MSVVVKPKPTPRKLEDLGEEGRRRAQRKLRRWRDRKSQGTQGCGDHGRETALRLAVSERSDVNVASVLMTTTAYYLYVLNTRRALTRDL